MTRTRAATRGRRRVVAAAAVAAAAALVLSSCSGEPEPGATSRPASSWGIDTPSPGGSGGTATSGPAQVPEPGATPLGAKWDWSRYTEFEPFLKTMAGGHTYYEVVWCDLEETQGRPDWTVLDRVVERSSRVGVTMMLKLRVGRCWATGGDAQHERGRNKTESAMPQNLDTYRGWVRSVVARYAPKGVHKYAIENEINSPSFWAGTPQEFATLAVAAAEQIRAADKSALVVDAGLSSTSYGHGLSHWLLKAGREADAVLAYKTYYERRIGTRGKEIPPVSTRSELERALAGEQAARNLSYLELMVDLRRRGVTDVRQIHFYERYTAVPMLFAYLRATTPPETPIEAWEVGSFFRGGPTDDAARTQEVVKTVSMVLAEGATVAIWLPLAFDPGGRNSDEPRLGLLEPDGEVRDVGRIFESVVAASRNAKVAKVTGGGLSGVAFEGRGAATAFVWSDKGSVVRLGAGESATAVGSGKPVSGEVTVGPEPVRMTLKRGAASIQADPR